MEVLPDSYSGGIPVFRPTMDEFKDFYKYNKAINKYGMQSGIVKVIPPTEWVENMESMAYDSESLKNVKIKSPIVQHINGSSTGVYKQQNIERQRTYNLFQWHQQSEKTNYQPPAPKGQTRGAIKESTSKDKSQKSEEEKLCKVDVSEFTEERCDQLERVYWKSLTYSEPMYGADMLGSLFPDSVKSWNVAHLPNILDMMDTMLPGVNDAYLYAGLWKATFAWHLEDQDLYSINYIHFGAPKQWYSIPQEEAPKFFQLMTETFYEEFKACPEFLRHKTFLVSPNYLKKHNIRYNKIVHNQKEFIITYPYGYHAGFNYGYNVAESVNFALDDWFPIGYKTKKCECVSDAVAINVEQLHCNYKGIPYNPEPLPIESSFDESEKEKQNTDETTMTKKSPKKSSVKERKTKTGEKKKNTSEPPRLIEHECILCSNNLPRKLLETESFELLEVESLTPEYQNKRHAHRICVLVFPNELTIENKKVYGLDNISKQQKSLKCSVCEQKSNTKTRENNACFQCSAPKCVRSFHGTCGLGDGVTYFFRKDQTVFNCKYHRRKKYVASDIVNLQKVKMGALIQFTYLEKKKILCGVVVSNNVQEGTLDVLSYPSLTDLLEVNYENVQVSDSMEALDMKLDQHVPDMVVNSNDSVESHEKTAKKRKTTDKLDIRMFKPNVEMNSSGHQNVHLKHQQQFSPIQQSTGPVMGTFHTASNTHSSSIPYSPIFLNHHSNGGKQQNNPFVHPLQAHSVHVSNNPPSSYSFVPQMMSNPPLHPAQIVGHNHFNPNSYHQNLHHDARYHR